MSGSSTRPAERVAFAVIFLVLPICFFAFVVRPTRVTLEALDARIEAADAQIRDLPNFQPLSVEERKVLLDPTAPWRQRLPIVSGDREKLAHYDRVVSLLQRTWGRHGVNIVGVRSSWDPIQASFTLPGALPPPLGAAGVSGPGELKAWVLEARISGGADRLFIGLEHLPAVQPMLEPVGLRWESTPEHRQQSLWLRNLVLEPLPQSAPGDAP
ncbi:MAG: hypothetical protein HYZ13_04350 [Acidobacteria bacterium]|nr:hypothetical protein [Acidobacteriota bacterium]